MLYVLEARLCVTAVEKLSIKIKMFTNPKIRINLSKIKKAALQ